MHWRMKCHTHVKQINHSCTTFLARMLHAYCIGSEALHPRLNSQKQSGSRTDDRGRQLLTFCPYANFQSTAGPGQVGRPWMELQRLARPIHVSRSETQSTPSCLSLVRFKRLAAYCAQACSTPSKTRGDTLSTRASTATTHCECQEVTAHAELPERAAWKVSRGEFFSFTRSHPSATVQPWSPQQDIAAAAARATHQAAVHTTDAETARNREKDAASQSPYQWRMDAGFSRHHVAAVIRFRVTYAMHFRNAESASRLGHWAGDWL